MVSIRHAQPDDVGAIAELLDELDRFYGTTETDSFDRRARQVHEALFTAPPAAYALTAWHDGKLVGLASYSFHWPAVGLTRSLFLKELYVVEEFRRSGIGKQLMTSLFEIARQTGCSRVEWTTDAYNTHAQKFYDSMSVPPDQSKIFYRLEGPEILDTTGVTTKSAGRTNGV